MKKTIRLHERDLHRVIKESVRRILNEAIDDEYYPETYTVDDLSELNAINAYYTPSDGHISVHTPEGYHNGEKEIPFRMVPKFEYDSWMEEYKVCEIFADAVSSDENTVREFMQYADDINRELKDYFDHYKCWFDEVETP